MQKVNSFQAISVELIISSPAAAALLSFPRPTEKAWR